MIPNILLLLISCLGRNSEDDQSLEDLSKNKHTPTQVEPETSFCDYFFNNHFTYDGGGKDRNLQVCKQDLSKLVGAAQIAHLPFWTLDQFKIIKNFANEHDLKVHVLGPYSESNQKNRPLSLDEASLQVGLGALAFVNDDNLSMVLNHEWGHVKDGQVLARIYPEIAPYLHSTTMKRDQACEIIKSYLDFFEKNLIGNDKKEFKKLCLQLVGDYSKETLPNSKLGVLLDYLHEAFRYGQETDKDKLRKFVFSDDYPHFKKKWASESKNADEFKYALQKADLKFVGLWNDLKQDKDFDQLVEENINKDNLRFFELAIHASRVYFSKSQP